MTWTDHTAHALGVLSLCVFAGAGVVGLATIAATAVPQWRRIVDTLFGRHLETPAASDAPRASAFPQHRGDEAAAAPALARARAARSHPHAR